MPWGRGTITARTANNWRWNQSSPPARPDTRPITTTARASSTVCVGTWPRSAVKEQESTDAHSNADTGQDLVVAASPLPEGMAKQIENSGRDIKVIQPKIEVLDRSMLAMQQRFHDYSVNGETQVNRITDPRTGKATDRTQPSFLVQIPQLQASLLRADEPQTPAGSPDTAVVPIIINPLAPRQYRRPTAIDRPMMKGRR